MEPPHCGEVITDLLKNSENDFTRGLISDNLDGGTQEQKAPKTQKRRKSVSFADTQGLALTSTFFFPKETFSPVNCHIIKHVAKYNARNSQKDGQWATQMNFKSPIPSWDFETNLHRNHVCLEKTTCNEKGIYGRIRVKNLAFQKEVRVRSTFDTWQSWQDTQANHVPGSSTRDTDTFFFHIKPPQSTPNTSVQFAVCYEVNGKQFWDNNFRDNYRLVYSAR